jgi:outer membrane lipoprotein-sorting protein
MKFRTMKPYPHIWLLTILCFFTTASFSQQDSRADKYLQTVSQQFDLNKAYVINMDYIREDLMQETSAEGEGVIWMKGLKYKIVVDEYIVYYNEVNLYSQNTEMEEVYVSEPDPDQPGYLQAVPIKIIKAYEQDFNYQYIGNTNLLGKNLIEIQLYPKDISGPYSMLKMFVNPVSLKLEATQLKHKEGILYTMLFSEIREDASIKDSMFDFDPAAFPNTEIIELIE